MYGLKDFSKASKLLFRTLYKEEEYIGHSVAGNRTNQNYDERPALGNPERLEVLYDKLVLYEVSYWNNYVVQFFIGNCNFIRASVYEKNLNKSFMVKSNLL